MNIGSLAKEAQVNVQTLRYYERLGILKPVQRRDSGYRVYDADSLQRVRFIKRAQDLGFSLSEIKDLLSLNISSAGSRTRARAKAKIKLAEIREKIAYLKKLESTLKQLVADCECGNSDDPCPILKKMEG
jgi:DNA-binding transcriptional MerR regulator